jgi:hypothetical protein
MVLHKADYPTEHTVGFFVFSYLCAFRSDICIVRQVANRPRFQKPEA